jgi:hypothetical protein
MPADTFTQKSFTGPAIFHPMIETRPDTSEAATFGRRRPVKQPASPSHRAKDVAFVVDELVFVSRRL